MFASLRHRGYRLWFAGALVSNVGTWMHRVAQDWLVLTRLTHDSGLGVGVTIALQFGPTLLLTPLAGVVADRVDRRRMLMVTQGAIGAVAAVLGGLVLSGQVRLWQVYTTAAALGVASAFDAPVRQTVVAELVPGRLLSNAVGLNVASFNAARMIGPAVAGVTIMAVGTGWVFMITTVSMLGAVGALAALRPDDRHPVPSAPRRPGQLREGLRYVRSRGDIVAILVVVGVVSTFGLNFETTSAMMARVEFGREAGAYGLLGSVLAVGSLTGALLAARRERPRVRLVVGAAFAFGLATGVQAVMPTFATYALACVLVGLAQSTMLTAANCAIQTSTPPPVRGRVMSLYLMVLLGASPVGAPLVGWIGQTFGPRWSIGIGTVASLAVSVVVAIWARSAWDVRVGLQRRRPYVRISHREPTAPGGSDDRGTAVASPSRPSRPARTTVR